MPADPQQSGRTRANLCYSPRVPTALEVKKEKSIRHSLLVRVTHWLTLIAFLALLVTGLEIVISHPRFYLGETGNVNMKPLFTIPIPASRDTVPTVYKMVMPDENGWSRYLHFEAAWVLVLTALVYGIASLLNGHFRRDLAPERKDWNWRAYRERIGRYLRRERPDAAESGSYNVLQRTAYVVVIFVLFPLIIWTGLAMSPAWEAAFPATDILLGGHQTARTLHFFLTWALAVFLVVHVAMVAVSGFRRRMRGMITGRAGDDEERS